MSANYVHALQRAKHHYGLDLTPADLPSVYALCRPGMGAKAYEDDEGEAWVLLLNGVQVAVFVSRKHHRVKTFLPPHVARRYKREVGQRAREANEARQAAAKARRAAKKAAKQARLETERAAWIAANPEKHAKREERRRRSTCPVCAKRLKSPLGCLNHLWNAHGIKEPRP